MANQQPRPPPSLLSGENPSPSPVKKQKLNNGHNELVSSPLNIISSDDEEEEMKVEVKAIGNVVRVRVSAQVGGFEKKHYLGFRADGRSYHIEDTVLVVPPDEHNLEMKPSVAIIKDIYETPDGSINVTGQKFYRPELLFNENGENLEPIESRRILYYSFDKCEFLADSVMHKCRVHYLERDKNIPSPKQHPGFIVRKVYDSASNKLNELFDSDFEEWKRREISLLVQRTNQIIN